jgi:hypothetical protein
MVATLVHKKSGRINNVFAPALYERQNKYEKGRRESISPRKSESGTGTGRCTSLKNLSHF